jgi:putative DNA primase/helicase
MISGLRSADRRRRASPVARAGDGERQRPPARARQTAIALWEAGRRLPSSLSERHCRRRGVLGALPAPDALRHHGLRPLSVYRPPSATRAAPLAAIRDAGREVTAVEITSLRPGEDAPSTFDWPARRLASSRRPTRCGWMRSARRWSSPTACSAPCRPGRCFRPPILRSWRPPSGVTSVLVAADGGPDGEASAKVLARPARPWSDREDGLAALAPRTAPKRPSASPPTDGERGAGPAGALSLCAC